MRVEADFQPRGHAGWQLLGAFLRSSQGAAKGCVKTCTNLAKENLKKNILRSLVLRLPEQKLPLNNLSIDTRGRINVWMASSTSLHSPKNSQLVNTMTSSFPDHPLDTAIWTFIGAQHFAYDKRQLRSFGVSHQRYSLHGLRGVGATDHWLQCRN